MPVRIGLLIYGSLDTLSGGYLYDRKLVEYLRQAGDSVEIISIPWRSYPARLADNLSSRLYQRLRSLDVDILLQDELNHPSLVLVNQQLRRRPKDAPPRPYSLISIVHHLRSSEQHPRWLLPVYRAVERSYLRTLDGFVFNSHTTRQSVATLLANPASASSEKRKKKSERRSLSSPLFPLSSPFGRSYLTVSGSEALSGIVAYPAADHLPVPDADAAQQLIRARQRRPGPLRILSVGNLIPRKGLHHLIAALSRLPPTDWQLDIVGAHTVDRGYTTALRRQITAAGLEANIRLRGRVSDRELAQRYSHAHLLAALSYEGFGIVYLEAMAFGLPALASVHGAASEIISHGINGFLVEPADAHTIAAHLSALARDRQRLATVGQNARQRFALHPRWADSTAAIRNYFVAVSNRDSPDSDDGQNKIMVDPG